MKSLPFLLLLLGSFTTVFGQSPSFDVSGKLVDASDESELVGATVLLINIKDSLDSKFAISDIDGNFKVVNVSQAFYRLSISSLGYFPMTKVIRITGVNQQLGTLRLERDVRVLDEVEVKGEVVAMEMKGDTVQYNAQAFKTNPDASASDLVAKMPGIVVSSTGVTANGESIEQVLLDGKRFFGQDPLLSLNTIPAEIVNHVQVYDEVSDQSKFTGFNDGNTTKTMNVVTKENKRNGQFGRFYGGLGTGDLYNAGVNFNSFDKDRRITVLGMSNNINQQNFSNQDLAGIGGGGRGGARSGASQNVMTGTQNGITTTNSLGINFSDKWWKTTTVEGSYFYNQTDNRNNQQTRRESFLSDQTQYYDESRAASTENLNHRLNLRIDHQINENNQLLFRSTVGYQDNFSKEETLGMTTLANQEVLNETNNTYTSANTSYTISNNLTYQHKFGKLGRTVSLDLGSSLNPTDRNSNYQAASSDSLLNYKTGEVRNNWRSTITYTEPVGNTAQLAASYELNTNKRTSEKDTYQENSLSVIQELIPSLSSHFTSCYTTQLPTFSYSNRKFGGFFNASLSYQNARLNSNQTFPLESNTVLQFNSILPSITGRYDLNESMNVFFRYRTSTSEPSISQLQTVIDNSNPLFLSVGNSNLNQSYTHNILVRISKNNFDKNITFSNFTNLRTTQDYITNATQILRRDTLMQEGISVQKGAQISKPINLNGYWNVRNSSTIGILIKPIKTNLNGTLGFSYTRLPGLTNSTKNISDTYVADASIGLTSNINEKIDYNLYYKISSNYVVNSIQLKTNSKYQTQTIGGKVNFTFPKSIVLRSDFYYLNYQGVSNSSDIHYTLWNLGLAKKFMKNDTGELELTVFDLLGENQSVSQKVTASYLEETQTQVLQRYFMLTFTYQLKRFKKSTS